MMYLIFGIFLLVMCVLTFLFTGGESARGISQQNAPATKKVAGRNGKQKETAVALAVRRGKKSAKRKSKVEAESKVLPASLISSDMATAQNDNDAILTEGEYESIHYAIGKLGVPDLSNQDVDRIVDSLSLYPPRKVITALGRVMRNGTVAEKKSALAMLGTLYSANGDGMGVEVKHVGPTMKMQDTDAQSVAETPSTSAGTISPQSAAVSSAQDVMKSSGSMVPDSPEESPEALNKDIAQQKSGLVDVVASGFDDDDAEVRSMAYEASRQLPQDEKNRLAALALESEYTDVRDRVLEAAAASNDPEDLRILFQAMGSDNSAVVSKAQTALAELTGVTFADAAQAAEWAEANPDVFNTIPQTKKDNKQ